MSDLLSAISVLLVFLTFLLQIVDKDISAVINKKNPFADKTNEIKLFGRELYKVLFLKSIPITLIFLITAYSILPKTIFLMRNGRVDFWGFDTLNTLFIFIQCGVIGLTIYSFYKTIKLIQKIYSLK